MTGRKPPRRLAAADAARSATRRGAGAPKASLVVAASRPDRRARLDHRDADAARPVRRALARSAVSAPASSGARPLLVLGRRDRLLVGLAMDARTMSVDRRAASRRCWRHLACAGRCSALRISDCDLERRTARTLRRRGSMRRGLLHGRCACLARCAALLVAARLRRVRSARCRARPSRHRARRSITRDRRSQP